VWDPRHEAPAHFSELAPPAARPDADDLARLRPLVERHVAETGSRAGRAVLEAWERASQDFWVLRPAPTALPAGSAATAVPVAIPER
jgi:glutamate synthase domain-containing protein 3